jgi:hypothetical protein
MESLRVSWESIRPKDSVPKDQEEPIRPPGKNEEAASGENVFEKLLEEEPICVLCHQCPVADEGDRCLDCINASRKKQEAESAAALAKKKPSSKDADEVRACVLLGHTIGEEEGKCGVCGWVLTAALQRGFTCDHCMDLKRQNEATQAGAAKIAAARKAGMTI